MIGHVKRKSIREDFEESFAGLDDTRSEHSVTPSRKVSESNISAAHVQGVESAMSTTNDDYLNSLLDNGPDNVAVSPSKQQQQQLQPTFDQQSEELIGHDVTINGHVNGDLSEDTEHVISEKKPDRKPVVDIVPEKTVAGALFAPIQTISNYLQQPIMNRYFVPRDYEKIIAEKSFITGPPKQGRYCILRNFFIFIWYF